MPDYSTICEKAARAGGAVLLDWVGRFEVHEKAPSDLVTEADLASQQVIRQLILDAYPEHRFLGEEDSADPTSDQKSTYRWLVDPLDGTTNYVHQLKNYSVSVALEDNGRLITGAIYNPVTDQCYTASSGQGAFLDGQGISTSQVRRMSQALVAASFPAKLTRKSLAIDQFIEVLLACQSVRRMGSAALNLAYVAAGCLDAYWSTTTKPWDVAAGALLVQEAGGIITSLDGGPFQLSEASFVVAANKTLHEQFLGILDAQSQ